MHLNAIKFTLFALLGPSVWGLPLQDDQIIARDDGIIPRDVAPEVLQDRSAISMLPKLVHKLPHIRKPWVHLPPTLSKI